jgi:hypothetical protein
MAERYITHDLTKIWTSSDLDTPTLGERYTDPTNGKAYIFLTGVASTVAGSWVSFDENFATTLLAANAVGPVAIASAATVASTKGWYQIYGVNTQASTDTIAADVALFIDGTAGRADDAVVAGDLIVGAYSMTADSANVATVFLNYPSVTNVLG